MSKINIPAMILGGAIGDALGVPVEFKSRGLLKQNPISDMIGFGTYDQPVGTWSDDTSLTLAFIETLINEKGWDIDNFAINASDWAFKSKFTPHGKTFDIGMATSNALLKYHNNIAIPSLCGGTSESSNGNGALMRIHPLLVLFIINDTNNDERFEMIKEVSCLTHNHLISHISCFFYIQFLSYLLYESKEVSYIKAVDDLKSLLLKDEYIEYGPKFKILLNDIFLLEEDDIFSSGYVIHSIEASVWCFMNTDNYKDSVLKAVNLGDDTDTIGSITGVMSGLYYGMEEIPIDWLSKLKKLEYIREYANKLYNICQ